MLSVMILAISGKCHPYHSWVPCEKVFRVGVRGAYLDTHSIDIDFFVQVIQ